MRDLPSGRWTMDARRFISMFPSKSIALCITDPPWAIQGGKFIRPGERNSTFITYPTFAPAVLARFMKGLKDKLVPGGHVYMFAPTGEMLAEIFNEFSADWDFLRLLVWDKQRPGLGAWLNDFEPVILLSNGPSRGYGSTRKYKSLLRFPAQPRTGKPWQIYKAFMDQSLFNERELAVDPFCGRNPLRKAAESFMPRRPWAACDIFPEANVEAQL